MLGKNQFVFNKLQMGKIIQHYFDTVLLRNSNIKVTGVDYRGSPHRDFIIRTEEVKIIRKPKGS